MSKQRYLGTWYKTLSEGISTVFITSSNNIPCAAAYVFKILDTVKFAGVKSFR